VLSRAFVHLYENYNPFWVTTLSIFFLHEITFLTCCAFYKTIEYIPWFNKYKIQVVLRLLVHLTLNQQDKFVSDREMLKCALFVLKMHVLTQFPMICTAHSSFEFFEMSHKAPLPSWYVMQLIQAKYDKEYHIMASVAVLYHRGLLFLHHTQSDALQTIL
jgi:hypothetical protein